MPESREAFDPSSYWEGRLGRFDVAAVGDRTLGAPYNRWLYRIRAFVFGRVLRGLDLDLTSAAILDVGSGTGFYVREWLRRGARSVVGSDLTEVATRRLGDRFPGVRFVRWDVTEAPPFPTGSFDAVSAFDVLFHVVDDRGYREALANLSALLDDEGLLLISENFVRGPAVELRHQVSRSRPEIEEALAAAGLEIVARRPMFVLMNAPIDSESRVLRRFWGVLSSALARRPALGRLIGAVLFPLEVLLLVLLGEGPSTEVVVCRRRRDGQVSANRVGASSSSGDPV